MCGSMADIQSAAAEIRRGKKKKERKKKKKKNKPQHENIMVCLLHRATIISGRGARAFPRARGNRAIVDKRELLFFAGFILARLLTGKDIQDSVECRGCKPCWRRTFTERCRSPLQRRALRTVSPC